MTQSTVNVMGDSKLKIILFSKSVSSSIYSGNWQMTTEID